MSRGTEKNKNIQSAYDAFLSSQVFSRIGKRVSNKRFYAWLNLLGPYHAPVGLRVSSLNSSVHQIPNQSRASKDSGKTLELYPDCSSASGWERGLRLGTELLDLDPV